MLEKLRQALTENGFGLVAEKLPGYVQETVIATTVPAREQDFRLGQSKIGGLTHLPPKFSWPTYKGTPLHCVAQINLSELPPGRVASELPGRGLLYFFYADGYPAWGNSLEDRDAIRVVHYDGELSELRPTERPAGQAGPGPRGPGLGRRIRNGILKSLSWIGFFQKIHAIVSTYDLMRDPCSCAALSDEISYQPCALTFKAAEELPTSLELFDLDELLAELEPDRQEQAEKIMFDVLYELDEDQTEEQAEEAPGQGRPEQSPPPEGLPSVELQQKMSTHAAKLIRESGLLGDGSKALNPEESMEAFMRITALINSDQGMQKLLAEAMPGEPEAQDGLGRRGEDDDPGGTGYSGLHKILGWPELVQGSVFWEAQYATSGLEPGKGRGLDEEKERALRAGVKDWRLLLQVDTDGNAEMMWGDAGTLYFLIKKDDLAAGNFDQAWFSWQCH